MTTSRISEVRVLSAPPPLGGQDQLLVGLQSDQGPLGLGEIGAGEREEILEAVEGFSTLLLGRSPLDREAAWHAMSGAAHDWEGDPALTGRVLAGLDTAAWDVAGKELAAPCVVLMGGKTRVRLEPCIECGPVADEAGLAQAKSLLERGVRIVSFEVVTADEADVDRLQRARRHLGAEALIIARLTAPLETVDDATAKGAALDRTDPFWIEGLLRDGRWDDLAKVRGAIASPVGAGAGTLGPRKFWRALAAECADIITPGLAACEGPTGALKLADLTDLRGVRLSVGAGATPVSALAATHISFARPHVSPLRLPLALLDALLEVAPDMMHDGLLAIPDAPGLGLGDAWHSGLETVASFAP